MESAPPFIEQFGYRQELKRSLGLFDLVVYGLVFIVPVSPMATFGVVYNLSHGMVPLVYAIGLVAMFFTAFSYVIGERFPLRARSILMPVEASAKRQDFWPAG